MATRFGDKPCPGFRVAARDVIMNRWLAGEGVDDDSAALRCIRTRSGQGKCPAKARLDRRTRKQFDRPRVARTSYGAAYPPKRLICTTLRSIPGSNGEGPGHQGRNADYRVRKANGFWQEEEHVPTLPSTRPGNE